MRGKAGEAERRWGKARQGDLRQCKAGLGKARRGKMRQGEVR